MGFTEESARLRLLGASARPARAEKYLKFLLDGYTLIPTIAVYMTGEAVTQSGGNMMKTFLLLSVSSVATAGALPSLPAKIILSAFVLMAVLTQAARRAPVGYQDEDGFHSVTS